MLSYARRIHKVFLVLLIVTFVLGACGRAVNETRTMADSAHVAIAVTPEALAAELEPADTLSEAADGLATLLGVNTSDILVRIQSRDCSVCKIDASGVEFPDMPVDDAESRLETNDKLWLVVQDLTCYYYYDGKTLSPLACGQDETVD